MKTSQSYLSSIFLTICIFICGCSTTDSTMLNWLKNNKEDQLIKYFQETLQEKDSEKQAKSIKTIMKVVVDKSPHKTLKAIEETICDKTVDNKIKIMLLEPLASSNLKPINPQNILDSYLNESTQEVKELLASYLSNSPADVVFEFLYPTYREAIEKHDIKLGFDLLVQYGEISKSYYQYISSTISTLEKYHEINKEIKKLHSNIESIFTELDSAKEEIVSNREDVDITKKLIAETFILNGLIIAQQSTGAYEIAVNGERALLISETQFTTRGLFTLSVRKTTEMPVQLKDEYGGFTQNWPLYVEENLQEDKVRLNEEMSTLNASEEKVEELIRRLDEMNSEKKRLRSYANKLLTKALCAVKCDKNDNKSTIIDSKKKVGAQGNPFAEIEKDICNPHKIFSLLADGPYLEFTGKFMFKAMSSTMSKEQLESAGITEKTIIEGMRQGIPAINKNPIYDSCNANVTDKNCGDIFKMIANSISKDPNMKQALGDDPTKYIQDAADEFKIKNCGVLAVKSKEKGTDEDFVEFMLGEIEGKYQIIFIVGN
jgi:hypothetical protein